MFADEGRLPQFVLHRFLEVQHLQTRQTALRQLVGFFGLAEPTQRIHQPVGIMDIGARIGVFCYRLDDGEPLERRLQIDRFTAVTQLQAAGGLARRVAYQIFGEGHQVLVVPVSGVKLHHRELGVVAHRDTFVAEVAVDLEHAVKATDNQTFQVELGRDAQVHALVQRIVVGAERFGIGAARNGVQHRRLNLQKTVPDHELADAADGPAACHETFARRLIHHQVNVTLAVLHFLVLHAMELVGHRAQTLGQQPHLRGMDGQLTGAGAEHVTNDTHDVAEVPVLEVFVNIGAQFLALDVDLDAPRAVLQRGETGFAHHAL